MEFGKAADFLRIVSGFCENAELISLSFPLTFGWFGAARLGPSWMPYAVWIGGGPANNTLSLTIMSLSTSATASHH